MIFGYFKSSSGIIFRMEWRKLGPWYVRFHNNEPIVAYHLDDLKNPSTTADEGDDWRYGA